MKHGRESVGGISLMQQGIVLQRINSGDVRRFSAGQDMRRGLPDGTGAGSAAARGTHPIKYEKGAGCPAPLLLR